MKTININLYNFLELMPNVQEKVLDNHRYINVEDYDWHETVIEDAKIKLQQIGFRNIDVQFSGFFSQGDGASFTADLNLETWIEQDTKNRAKYTSLIDVLDNIEIVRLDSRYSHENTVKLYVNINCDAPETLHDLKDILQHELNEEIRDLSREIFKDLEDTFTALISDESVTETLLDREYTYEANGIMRND